MISQRCPLCPALACLSFGKTGGHADRTVGFTLMLLLGVPKGRMGRDYEGGMLEHQISNGPSA